MSLYNEELSVIHMEQKRSSLKKEQVQTGFRLSRVYLNNMELLSKKLSAVEGYKVPKVTAVMLAIELLLADLENVELPEAVVAPEPEAETNDDA